jgi:acetyltransferase
MLSTTDIPLLQGLRETVLSLDHAIWYSDYLKKREARLPDNIPRKSFLANENNLGRSVLSEYDSKKVLSSYGIDCIKEELARSQAEAIQAAEKLGYPTVLKVSSPDIPHKTEAGGILMNIGSKNEVELAYDKVIENAVTFNPEAEIQGVLVQKTSSGGVETIMGVKNDPQVGPVLMFGLGGIFVDLLKDVSLKILPITEKEAISMIHEIKGIKVLKGLRGNPKADIGAIVKNLLGLASFALAYKDDVSEVDINPFVVFEEGQGGVAIDALITTRTDLKSSE